MPHPVLAVVLMGPLGLIVGAVLAAVSARLARADGRLVRGRFRDPLIIVAAGGVGVWAALQGHAPVAMAATVLLGWQLLLIAVVDGETFWLPDRLTVPLIATGLIAHALMAGGVPWPQIPWPQILGAVLGFAMLWLLAALYRLIRKRDGLGSGDPFLFAGAGAWVGWTGLPSVLLWACGVGLGVVLIRLALRRTVGGDDRLPFGTFLAVGIWLTWLFGPLGV